MYKKPAGPQYLIAAWLIWFSYVSQKRFHYQAFLKHGLSVLDIKPVMIVTN